MSLQKNERIRVLITGGTFDKEYDEISGRLFFKDSHLPEMLALGRCKLDLEIRTLMMIDSLEMTDADRALCRAVPRDSGNSHRDYARHGYNRRHRKNTLADGGQNNRSDRRNDSIQIRQLRWLFNLGSALAFVQTLPPGVYVAMNGRCFRLNGSERTGRPASSKRRNRNAG